MSINVTVTGNPINIRRGRMILSDLDQIKKNERDRRRRLRLEQVRQQSKEISNRLLERAKNLAKEELSKLEKDGKSELKRMHDRKIMEIQQKYHEDMADIGQAHASAALELNADEILEADRQKNRAVAVERGKKVMHQMKEIGQAPSPSAIRQERLRQVRELENMRSSMISKLPKEPISEHQDKSDSNSSQGDAEQKGEVKSKSPKRKKTKKILSKKSPKKILKSLTKVTSHANQKSPKSPILDSSKTQKHCTVDPNISSILTKTTLDKTDLIEEASNNLEEQMPRETIPISNSVTTRADKIARYNPEDYTQNTSDSNSSGSSTSVSDDSSYFSDSGEQSRSAKTPKHHTSLAGSKIRLYDYTTRQRNTYDEPPGVVERIDMRNEPNAVDAAKEIEQSESMEVQLTESHKSNAQRRGEDAILREKVRRDYQTLIQNLDHLAREERKLKACQVQCHPVDNVHMRSHTRKQSQEEQRKRLDRAFKSILNNSRSPNERSHLIERVVTLSPQESEEVLKDVPDATWQKPFVSEHSGPTETQDKYKETDLSREEQILDMLKKVERQKRLLLQEFGADLPDNIFNRSIRPLFETSTYTKPSIDVRSQRPLSPEIKVVNMSSCDETVKKKTTKKKDTLPLKKIEIAVQTGILDRNDMVQDKSVQVELIQEKHSSSSSEPKNEHTVTTNQYPIEPKIIVVTPEAEDSSSSSRSSIVTGIVIDIDNKELKVTPKKKKSNSQMTKRTASGILQKSRSRPFTKTGSPARRYIKSLPASRVTTPRKSYTTSSPRRKIDIRVDKTGFNIKVDPPQDAKIAVDASTESSQIFSSLDAAERSGGKPYQIQAQTKRMIRIRDTSDTSTSFASPPPVIPKSVPEAPSTPILEMLDSSINESMRTLRRDISPVSTPETPSPRTMMMPSNIPHPDKMNRIFRYTSTDSQTNDTTILSSTQNDHSTSTNPSDYQNGPTSSEHVHSTPRQSITPSKLCSCKNPGCRLLHIKLNDIQDYALKNCPEILKKYEDLQNMCTERIASLTDLIARVRNEQKGMELSMISPGDETSLMQLPPLRPQAHTDLQSVRRLVESIETIHNQLARTLIESQRIIATEVVEEEEPSHDAELQLPASSSPENKSINAVNKTTAGKTGILKSKAKPKIISDERVNIQLNQFKMQQRPRTVMAMTTPERKSWPPQKVSVNEEDIIEKLSKEILEQSKGLDKSSNNSTGLKEFDVSSVKQVLSPSNINSSTNSIHSKTQESAGSRKEEHYNQEVKRDKEFVPLLAGIPKIPRTLGNVISTNGRGKPPVTLLSGPYRVEMESSGHELSTIVEFDTPDTVNKSLITAKSPIKGENIVENAMKSQKSPTKKSAEAQASKCLITVKPSVHVAPLPTQHIQHFIPGKSQDSPSTKETAEVTMLSCKLQDSAICSSKEKLNDVQEYILKKSQTKRTVNSILDKSNKELQYDAVDKQLPSQQVQLASSANTDANDRFKDNKDKITSTSSNSFSGLSGISEITSTPSSEILKYASSPEEMESALKKLGLGWAITTLKKTREASALSSSSNSDVTPLNTARRMISPSKKQFDVDARGLPDFSDVSSISIKEASKSTDQAVLLKGRTSTPKLQNSNTNSGRSNSSTTNYSGTSFQEPSDSLTVPNVSLTKTKQITKQLENL